MESALESPRPLPVCFVVKYGSHTFGRISGGMPTPVSRIEIFT
jgi:hypothetical protein